MFKICTRRVLSAERTLNLERVVLIVIRNSCRGGGADDKFVTLVVTMVYGRMSAFIQQNNVCYMLGLICYFINWYYTEGPRLDAPPFITL